MTSIPSRMHRIAPIIIELLKQSFVFDRLILFLPHYCVRQQSCYTIPPELVALQSDRFEIRRCDADDGPATKIIPAMHAFCFHEDPCVVISVDDDVFLDPHAIQELVEAHTRDPASILGFMGVIAPQFFHGEMINQETLNVMILGGYRAILYPQYVFRTFIAMFDEIRQSSALSEHKWPYPIMDDDYLTARIAHALRVDCKVVRTNFRRYNRKLNFRTLNIRLDQNLDGVSGKQGSENHIDSSRVATDAFFAARHKTSLTPNILHIICRPSKQSIVTQQQRHKFGINTIFATHDKFQNTIDMPTLVAYLMRLFHPTVRDTPFRGDKRKSVEYVLVTHCAWFVDYNRVVSIVKKHMHSNVMPSMEMVGTDLTYGMQMLLLPRDEVFALIADHRYKPESLLKITERTIDRWIHLRYYVNLANVVCFLTSDDVQITALREFWDRQWTPVAQVWYCNRDITAHVHKICEENKPRPWQCDGTNAQMDAIFGDPAPGVAKWITIHLHDGKIIAQNTDWMFCIKDQVLMCR